MTDGGGAAGGAVVGGLDLDQLAPAQRRMVEGLMAVGTPRPPFDPDRAGRIRAMVESRIAGAVEGRDADAPRIVLGKTKLDALGCDGRYLDMLATPFEWSAATVRGQLVHGSIELDHQTGRQHTVVDLMDDSWEQFRHSGDSALAFTSDLTALESERMKADAVTAVEEFRAVFPPLPRSWSMVWEPTIAARFGAGAVTVKGKPDLVLGRPHPHERRMLLADLKTGSRSGKDRADMRIYALLATLKYGQAPFRVATIYIDEGAFEHEDVTDDVLEAAARGLADRLNTALRLTDRPEAVNLSAGPACRWCGLAPTCPERQRWDDERADTATDALPF
ncbi:PD-(D/E)XK nuclease family protein [Euzebya rosea]|uniref:PD-(D/E)XK nuclease family protein n=1 Tax=Euzebya rosea TaxID=2052804 RepID=UPI0013003F2C|nr:PD-(D/E)XK nuclease family protein [Euzebya rosea]